MHMKKTLITLMVLLSMGAAVSAQNFTDRPKLVVGVVVDQMRMDYIYRYYAKFGAGGFKRIVGDGFYLSNAHYNYVPTYTGPGHASVYTGSTPALHGIIGNEWYDKDLDKDVNCVEDSLYTIVGGAEGGDVSPSRLLATTITDELKIFTQQRSKVVGISIKNRSAVFPAGHNPDGAYWFDDDTGNFVTSTYYKQELPQWVSAFNAKKLPDTYIASVWTPLLPLERYEESTADETTYESRILQKSPPVFPYKVSEGDYGSFIYTPFANDLLVEFAKAAVVAEQMGADAITDFLAVSFSTPDILGHAVGPQSIEIEDAYLRLDKALADLLSFLDKQVGTGQFTLFLTADHGAAEVPQYMMDNKMPGKLQAGNLQRQLNEFLAQYFTGAEVVKDVSNGQVFLNHEAFRADPKASGIDLLVATELIGNYLMQLDGVAEYYTRSDLRHGSYGEEGIKGMVIRGFNAKRSGDIAFILKPGWIAGRNPRGTTHGSPYTYDTHVPILFYGWGIPKGTSSQYHTITDIAPTLSVLLKIKFPSAATGRPVSEMLDR